MVKKLDTCQEARLIVWACAEGEYRIYQEINAVDGNAREEEKKVKEEVCGCGEGGHAGDGGNGGRRRR